MKTNAAVILRFYEETLSAHMYYFAINCLESIYPCNLNSTRITLTTYFLLETLIAAYIRYIIRQACKPYRCNMYVCMSVFVF